MVEGAGALLRVLPVRINANGKALTVEELDTMKKDMHLAAFRYAADELRRGLRRVAVERDAVGRLSRDWNRVLWDGKTLTPGTPLAIAGAGPESFASPWP